MMSVGQVREWLKDVPDDADIGIDDGGLCLVTRLADSEGWEDVLELGGIPLPEEEELDRYEVEGIDPLEAEQHAVEAAME